MIVELDKIDLVHMLSATEPDIKLAEQLLEKGLLAISGGMGGIKITWNKSRLMKHDEETVYGIYLKVISTRKLTSSWDKELLKDISIETLECSVKELGEDRDEWKLKYEELLYKVDNMCLDCKLEKAREREATLLLREAERKYFREVLKSSNMHVEVPPKPITDEKMFKSRIRASEQEVAKEAILTIKKLIKELSADRSDETVNALTKAMETYWNFE